MSTGSNSGPDDKPGPVFGSGGCDDEESGDGFLVFSVLDVVDFGGVGGRFPDNGLGGGERDRFGGAAARRVVSSRGIMGAPVSGSGSACSTSSAI